jgi:hypothetical protein
VNNRLREDVTSWRTRWNLFLEIIDHCNCKRVYIIVDSLNECQDNDLADFLRPIVRNRLDHPSKIKWILTSRPLDSAERELLAGRDQVKVSLELNSGHVSDAVHICITFKVDKLSRRQRYREKQKHTLQAELTKKAEGTFL